MRSAIRPRVRTSARSSSRSEVLRPVAEGAGAAAARRRPSSHARTIPSSEPRPTPAHRHLRQRGQRACAARLGGGPRAAIGAPSRALGWAVAAGARLVLDTLARQQVVKVHGSGRAQLYALNESHSFASALVALRRGRWHVGTLARGPRPAWGHRIGRRLDGCASRGSRDEVVRAWRAMVANAQELELLFGSGGAV